MKLECKLAKRDFTTDDGNKREYYVIQFELFDGQVVDIPIKGDKAKLLILDQAIQRKDK